MYKLAVIGNPVEHSLSPSIWTEFGKETGIQLSYGKICAPLDSFEHYVHEFFADNGYALSVTAPFKARSYGLANQHNPHTLLSQTANHLVYKDGLLIADNTDGMGLVNDLNLHLESLTNKNILIIGSGSVIYSILSSLTATHPARIDLLMRDINKLDDFILKSSLIDSYDPIIEYDVVINTTPNVSENNLFDEVKSLSKYALAYDMAYTARQTLFLQKMATINPSIKQVNGIGMLIQQAASAFQFVFGIKPSVKPIYSLLKDY